MRHFLFPLIAVVLLVSAVPRNEIAPPLSIQINVQPSIADPYQLLERQTPDTYTCSVLVFDAGSKKVVAALPKVVVSPGKAQKAKSTSGDYKIEFSVKIDSATNVSAPADRADTHVIVRRNDAIVSEQRSIVALLHGKSRNMPIQ